jgi:hypothetical protein
VEIENADVGDVQLPFEPVIWANRAADCLVLNRVCQSRTLLLAVDNFSSPKTICNVIVDHPCGLHVRIADRRTDKFEAALLQVFTQRIRLGAGRWVIFQSS